jgi:glycosyltransferase involved in cell wall biosynthesis
MGAAYGPRNIALRQVTSDYIMFLDADDTFEPEACEILYGEISHSGVDMVFGRYYRVYDDFKLKSYSPYTHSPNDIKVNPRFSGPLSFFWSRIAYPILYGRAKPAQCRVVIDDIRDNPEILKILPSLWARIVRRDSIGEFPELITGEDLNFILDVYNKGKIIFLNNKYITDYNMRFDGDLSITKNIKFSLVYDSIRAYRMAVEKCNEYNIPEYNKMINPFLLNYINLVRQGEFTETEKNELLGEIDAIDAIYRNRGMVGRILVRLARFLTK